MCIRDRAWCMREGCIASRNRGVAQPPGSGRLKASGPICNVASRPRAAFVDIASVYTWLNTRGVTTIGDCRLRSNSAKFSNSYDERRWKECTLPHVLASSVLTTRRPGKPQDRGRLSGEYSHDGRKTVFVISNWCNCSFRRRPHRHVRLRKASKRQDMHTLTCERAAS